MVVLGQVGDQRHGDAHVDPRPDGDGKDGEEERSPRAGAGQVEVALRHRLVGLQGAEPHTVTANDAFYINNNNNDTFCL